MAEVRFEHVTKSYTPGTNVISDLNLAVNDHEFLVLVGPSGCGKSDGAAHDRRAGGDYRRRPLHR